MNFNNFYVENFLGNFSFAILFFTMTLYWVDTAFFTESNKIIKVNSNEDLMLAASTNQLSNNINIKENVYFNLKPTKQILMKISNIGIIIANLSLCILLIFRWKISGHFPLSNLYESLMFLSWNCTFIHLFLIYNYTSFSFTDKQGALAPSAKALSANPVSNLTWYLPNLIGCVSSPCALFLNAFATFSLPKEMQQAAPLVPALQSNWLMMHVSVMILSYAALILGSLISIAFLVLSAFENRSLQPNTSNSSNSSNSMETLKQTLDNLSYRVIGIGFPFLTIGILSGAVWANEAWGSYWSWDPKETWALLTWLIFAIYLHTRLTKGWEGRNPALIASLGFIVVWICFLGVNLIGDGLHSYGFFKSN